jgi:hypothetical protein
VFTLALPGSPPDDTDEHPAAPDGTAAIDSLNV